jgi:LmbE family N-acetylglucosaminyl deacetylase
MPPRYRAVVISPHPDDAVFSCGGWISELARAGRVLVVNVFTEYARSFKAGPVSVGEQRYEEEREAGRLLGFESLRLGEMDAACRHEEYRRPSRLFSAPIAADVDELPRLTRSLQARLDGLHYDLLLAPLGIGWHVDHVLAHRVARQLTTSAPRLFYEDAPYTLLPALHRHRMREISAAPGGGLAEILRDATRLTRAYASTAPMRALPRAVRVAAPVAVAAFFGRLLARHSPETAQARRNACQPTARVVPLSTTALGAKMTAIWAYTSQAREFFLDRRDCCERYATYSADFAQPGGYAERYWDLQPS